MTTKFGGSGELFGLNGPDTDEVEREEIDGVAIDLQGARVVADLVEVGMAALAAFPIPSTAAVENMRRARMLAIGAAFVDLVNAEPEVE
jgi:hypothetical protein